MSLPRFLATLPMAFAAMLFFVEVHGAQAYEDDLSGDMAIFGSPLPEGAVCDFVDGQTTCGPDTLLMTPMAGKPERNAPLSLPGDKAAFVATTVELLAMAGFNPLQTTSVEGSAVLHTRVITDDANLMAELLYAFTPFPEVRDRLLRGVIQKDMPRSLRFARFQSEAGILAETAWSLLRDDVSRREGQTYAAMLQVWNATPEGESILNTGGRERIGEKREIAAVFLDALMDMMEGELEPKGQARAVAATSGPEGARDGLFPTQAAFAGRSVSRAEAIDALWRNRHRGESKEILRKALASPRGTPDERLKASAIALTATSTTLDEAFGFVALAPDTDALGKIWRHSGGLLEETRYLHPLSPTLETALKTARGGIASVPLAKSADRPGSSMQGRTPAGNRTGDPKSDAVGRIVLKRLDETPDFETNAHLFLLVRDPLDVPQALRPTVFQGMPVLDGTPLGFMKEGPRLAPLHPKNGRDKELLAWFATQGAKTGKAVLVSSRCSLENLARRMAGWHVLDVNGSFMLADPLQGRMLGYLAEHAGESAAGFFGPPGTGMWFMEPEDDGWAWFTVNRPGNAEEAVPPVSALSLDAEQASALSAALLDNRRRVFAYALAARQSLPGTSGAESTRAAVQLVRTYDAMLEERFKGAPFLERRKSLELLWRGRAAGVDVESILFGMDTDGPDQTDSGDLGARNIKAEAALLPPGR